jgi:predicted RNA polymerase sigma factor
MDLETVYREQRPRALATLIRLLGDFDLAEEALQDGFAAALEQWPAAGVPRNPCAWLVSTARHKAIDRLRRARTLARSSRERSPQRRGCPLHLRTRRTSPSRTT